MKGERTVSEQMQISKGLEDLKAEVEAKVQTALQEYATRPREQVAEPLFWWDLIAYGPIQFGAQLVPPSPIGGPGPRLPHQVIRVGEDAVVFTILLLNPLFPSPGPMSACDILSNFALPYQVQYCTGNVCTWQLGPANLNVTNPIANFTPGQCFAIDSLEFTAQQVGVFEMTISARILNALNNPTPPFAGFARAVFDIDPDMLFPAPGWQFDFPIRFQVYE
jgi:hypothetical protein